MRSRDRQADIERVYRERFMRFERFARAVTMDHESALDAVQDRFADALRAAGSFEGRGSLEAWIWRCVLNRARKARLIARQLPSDGTYETRDDREEHCGDEALRACVAALPERQRLAVFLRYYADLDYQGIADVLEVKVGTVSATLAHAHAALRETFVEALR